MKATCRRHFRPVNSMEMSRPPKPHVKYAADRVTWYSNDDGQGTFAIGLDLSTSSNGAYALALADLDGDDDLDVVSASVWDGLAWYENSDGNGVFSLGISLEPGEPAK